MSIRTIKFKVEADKITPSSLQRGGLQGEHNATELEFLVENSLAEKLESASMGGALCYRFEGHTGTGMRNSTLPVRFDVPGGSIKEFALKYLLENWLTREGGNITVFLIFSVLSEDETLVDLFSYPARLSLEAVPDGKYTDGKNYESVAKLSVAAEDAAERAENAAEISEAAKEQTVDARFALENGAEFIFMGGDAKGAAEVDLVVDNELSEHSSNPISNEATAKEFQKYTPTEELNQLLENLLNKQIETIADYIVEQGEKDGWRYEKWNSGKAIVERHHYHSFEDNELTPDGNRYITINQIRFPDNLFTKTPTIASINSNVHYIGVNYNPDSSSSKMAYIIISSGINLGLGYSVGYSIEIKGTWK